MLEKENESTQRNGIIYSHTVQYVARVQWPSIEFIIFSLVYENIEKLHYLLVYISFFVFKFQKVDNPLCDVSVLDTRGNTFILYRSLILTFLISFNYTI